MTPILILLAMAAVASLVMLVRTVAFDGYGHRTPPRSHVPDEFAASRELHRA